MSYTMEFELRGGFSNKYPKGTVVVIDKIRYSKKYAHKYAVRVVNLWKNPRWFDIGWVVESPDIWKEAE